MGSHQVGPDTAKVYKPWAVSPWLGSVAFFPVLSPFQVPEVRWFQNLLRTNILPVAFLGNTRAPCEPHEPGNPSATAAHQEACTWLFHRHLHLSHCFSSPDSICRAVLLRKPGHAAWLSALSSTCGAVDVSCLMGMPSVGPCSQSSLMVSKEIA